MRAVLKRRDLSNPLTWTPTECERPELAVLHNVLNVRVEERHVGAGPALVVVGRGGCSRRSAENWYRKRRGSAARSAIRLPSVARARMRRVAFRWYNPPVPHVRAFHPAAHNESTWRGKVLPGWCIRKTP